MDEPSISQYTRNGTGSASGHLGRPVVFVEFQDCHPFRCVVKLVRRFLFTDDKSLVTALYRRLDESFIMARSQREAHTEFSKTFSAEAVAKWSEQVDQWCADPSNTQIENPFEEPTPTITMADIRRELNAEEAEDLARGTVPAHAISASQYMVAGLHLEDQQ